VPLYKLTTVVDRSVCATGSRMWISLPHSLRARALIRTDAISVTASAVFGCYLLRTHFDGLSSDFSLLPATSVEKLRRKKCKLERQSQNRLCVRIDRLQLSRQLRHVSSKVQALPCDRLAGGTALRSLSYAPLFLAPTGFSLPCVNSISLRTDRACAPTCATRYVSLV